MQEKVAEGGSLGRNAKKGRKAARRSAQGTTAAPLEEEAEHVEDFVADFHVAQIGFFNEP